jgi:predicted acylesterase/phospholipase RssA
MDLQPKIWEAARATSAATTFFDPVGIGKYGQSFIDGGGGYNNPVQVAFDEANTCFPTRDIDCLVSIGAGKGTLKAFGRNLVEVGKTLIAMATETEETATAFAHAHPELSSEGQEQRLFRFQVDDGMDSVGMEEHEKIKEIAAATQVYMQSKGKEGTKQLQGFKALMAGL